MRKYNIKVKKRGRKQLHSKSRGFSQNRDESNKFPELSARNARIKSAIENGSRILLPSDTNGTSFSKFEHIGKEGPLIVFAEDKKLFNEFGHFSVITSFKPYDSLRNQLFFPSKPVSESLDYKGIPETAEIREMLKNRTKEVVTRDATNASVNSRLLSTQNNSEKVQTRRQHSNSFERLVKRYKERQDKYLHLMGNESLYLFKKIDRMCKAGKNEVDTNFPVQGDPSHDSKKKYPETEKDQLFFPRIVSEPGQKVQIKLPTQEDCQYVLKTNRNEKLPSIS